MTDFTLIISENKYFMNCRTYALQGGESCLKSQKIRAILPPLNIAPKDKF